MSSPARRCSAGTSPRAPDSKTRRSISSGSISRCICRRPNLAQQIEAGKLDDFRNNPNSVIVGSRLAERFSVESGRLRPAAFAGRRIPTLRRRRDRAQRRRRGRCRAHLLPRQSRADRSSRKPYTASMIIYKLRDPDRAPGARGTRFETLFQSRDRELAGTRRRQPATLPHDPALGRDHGLADHSARRLRNL